MSTSERIFIVRVEEGLHTSRLVGMAHKIVLTPGVEAVYGTDLEMLNLTQDQYTLLLGLPQTQPQKRKRRRG